MDRRDAFVDAVQQAPPDRTIDLVEVVGSDWERVVFVGPYATNDDVRSDGLDFDIEAVSPWVNTEGGTVVVLADGAKPVAWFTVSSEDVGLHCLNGVSLSATEATLTVDVESSGLRNLIDPDLAWC